MMNTSPFSTAFVTKLISTSTRHMIACLSFLHNNSASVAFAVIVLHVQNHCLIFCAFTIVFEIHAFFTKLFLALNALKWMILNYWNDTLTVLRRTHSQKRVIRCEMEFLYFFEQLFRFRV